MKVKGKFKGSFTSAQVHIDPATGLYKSKTRPTNEEAVRMARELANSNPKLMVRATSSLVFAVACCDILQCRVGWAKGHQA